MVCHPVIILIPLTSAGVPQTSSALTSKASNLATDCLSRSGRNFLGSPRHHANADPTVLVHRHLLSSRGAFCVSLHESCMSASWRQNSGLQHGHEILFSSMCCTFSLFCSCLPGDVRPSYWLPSSGRSGDSGQRRDYQERVLPVKEYVCLARFVAKLPRFSILVF